MEALDLSDFFKTKSQANDFAGRLARISEAIYQTNFNLEALLLSEFGIQKRDKFLTLLREQSIRAEDHTALKEFMRTLQDVITKLPVLSITLAFAPKEQTLKVMSEWFMSNVKSQVLFDVNVDTALIAGCAITYKGKYLDFSIKPKFEQILLAALHPVQAPNGIKPPPAHNQPTATNVAPPAHTPPVAQTQQVPQPQQAIHQAPSAGQ